MKSGIKNNDNIRAGIIAGLPLVIGYIPVAIAFGILSKTVDISMLDSFLFSALVFAGASQFIALNLLSVGVGGGEIILTTLLVNFRHFLMSASLATKFSTNLKRWIPLIAFGVTDEFFSVISFRKEQITKSFILSLQLTSYAAWVGGTVLGYFVGGLLPKIVQDSMGIALYAMFAAILMPEAKKSPKVIVLAILSGIINTLLSFFSFLPQGWSMIVAIILASGIGVYLYNEQEVNGDE